MRIPCLLFLLFFFKITTSGQEAAFLYENRVYKNTIKTVQCYNSRQEQSIPVLTLGSDEHISFSFDELGGAANLNYAYTLEHCTFDWKPSGISPMEYLESFSTDQILNYRLSFNTIQKYVHYELSLPNFQIKPKIAGNYLLKVYEQGSPQKPVISWRIYINKNQVNVGAEVVPSSQVADRFSNQKLNFTIFHNFQIPNPYSDIKALVMQNYDPNTTRINTKPAFIRQGALVYNDLTTNDFPGGNEFRKADFRSLNFKGENVQDIFRDSVNSVILYQDDVTSKIKYSNQFDQNGVFFIRNQYNRDGKTENDYARVFFALRASLPANGGNAYVVGGFNNYQLSDANKLVYQPDRKTFNGNTVLKQGLYDYKYIWVDNTGKINPTIFEGNFFETENNYQVFVYYRKPGGRWDELIGFTNINTVRR